MFSDKFSLKWNDFQGNVARTFSSLRSNNSFQDVTLVADDQKQISAHKVVLSSCSEYFDVIFKQNIHSHPLLCLDGINSKELNNVLDYIYNGQVKIFEEDVVRFLQIAQRLKLQGLLETTANECQTANLDVKYEVFGDQNAGAIETSLPGETLRENLDVNSVTFADQNTEVMQNTINNYQGNKIDAGFFNVKTIEELDQKIQSYYVKIDGKGFQCIICKYCSNKRFNMKEHIDTHLEGLSIPCHTCGRSFKSRKQKRNHQCIGK